MKRTVLFALLVAAGFYLGYDLTVPRHHDLRHIDPVVVGRIETAMWRSYYETRRVRLFWQMGELLRAEYGLPPARSLVAAYHAARAAFVFKRGRSRGEYEQALPSLRRYFAMIRNAGNIPFDVDSVARLELEWWIVHRERAEPPGPLDRACAAAAAAIYGTPPERLAEHGYLRAEAMRIRDRRAAEGGVTDDDWGRIEALLVDCYRALVAAVNQSTPSKAAVRLRAPGSRRPEDLRRGAAL